MQKYKKILLWLAAALTALAGGVGVTQLGASNYMEVTKVMDAVTATTTGNFTLSQNYRNIVYSIDTSGSANAFIQFVGSIGTSTPSTTLARSNANQFEYIVVVDLEDGTAIDGDTGIQLTGTDDNRLIEVNTNLLRWVAPVLTRYSAGTINIQAVAGDNQ